MMAAAHHLQLIIRNRARSFDVGDVLLLGNGEWHQVEAIALQVTTLLRWDGVKVCGAASLCELSSAAGSLFAEVTHGGCRTLAARPELHCSCRLAAVSA